MQHIASQNSLAALAAHAAIANLQPCKLAALQILQPCRPCRCLQLCRRNSHAGVCSHHCRAKFLALQSSWPCRGCSRADLSQFQCSVRFAGHWLSDVHTNSFANFHTPAALQAPQLCSTAMGVLCNGHSAETSSVAGVQQHFCQSCTNHVHCMCTVDLCVHRVMEYCLLTCTLLLP